jgi:RNA polymerase sigma-70 factor (ECF subfamily)
MIPGVISNGVDSRAVEPSDRELMLRLRQRDVRALELLYDRYSQLALGLSCKILHDRALAEDVVQDAFLTVWRQPERFDPTKGNAKGWLLAFVHHRSVDRLRRLTVRGFVGELSPNVLDEDAPDPADVAFATMTREQITVALGRLPADQRRAIELSYLQGWTHREIADAMNCPLGTVKGRIRIGLEKLRTLIPASAVLATA